MTRKIPKLYGYGVLPFLMAFAAPTQGQDALWDVSSEFAAALDDGDLERATRLGARDITECERQVARQADCVQLYLATAMVALGGGLHEQAFRFASAGAELARRDFPADFFATGVLYRIAGQAKQADGDFAEALRWLEAAYEYEANRLGMRDMETAKAAARLAKIHEAMRTMRKGEAALRIALGVAEGSNTPEEALYNTRLAQNLAAQTRYNDAEDFYRAALAIYLANLPDDHPWVATAYTNLAANLNSQRRKEEAYPLFVKALEIRDAVLQPDDPDRMIAYVNLAANLSDLERLEEAEALLARAIELGDGVGLGDSYVMALALHNLAGQYLTRSRHADAERMFAQAIERLERLGPGAREVLAFALKSRAGALISLERWVEARAVLERSFALVRQIQPKHHNLRIDLAWALSEMMQRFARSDASRAYLSEGQEGVLVRLELASEFDAASRADLARYRALFVDSVDLSWTLARAVETGR